MKIPKRSKNHPTSLNANGESPGSKHIVSAGTGTAGVGGSNQSEKEHERTSSGHGTVS